MQTISRGFSLFLVAPAVIMSGCAIIYPGKGDERFKDDALIQREKELQSMWRGKSYLSLVSAYGQPRVFMDVPGHRALKTSVAVFGIQNESVKCIDAFTIIVLEKDGENIVADYFCR